MRKFSSIKSISLQGAKVRLSDLESAYVGNYFDNIENIYMNGSIVYAPNVEAFLNSNIKKSGILKNTYYVEFDGDSQKYNANDIATNYNGDYDYLTSGYEVVLNEILKRC